MTNELWSGLVTSLGFAGLAANPRFATEADRRENYELVEETVAMMARNRTRSELWDILSSLGLSSAPVLSVGESLADPHLKERNAFVEINHPTAGKVKVSAPWIRFSKLQALSKRRRRCGDNTITTFSAASWG